MAHFKGSAAPHTQNAGLYSRQLTASSKVRYMSQPRYSAAFSIGIWAVSMPGTLYCDLTMWPIPRDQQLLSCNMLGPIESIGCLTVEHLWAHSIPSNRIFESTTGGPAEVFGSLLKRNVGHFNKMASIF
jgi:hypothetical protein